MNPFMTPVFVTAEGERPLNAQERARYQLDRESWLRTSDLRTLAEYTAQWLEGRRLCMPGYGAANPDPETTPLIPYLAAYNRAGLMTTGSQPGHGPLRGYDGWNWSQRAFVDGFTDLDTATRIVVALSAHRDAGIVVNAWAPGSHRGDKERAALTVRVNPQAPAAGFDVTAADGYPLGRGDIRSIYRGDLTRGAIRTLQNAWQITVHDEQFSERTLLWDALAEALAPDPAGSGPHDELPGGEPFAVRVDDTDDRGGPERIVAVDELAALTEQMRVDGDAQLRRLIAATRIPGLILPPEGPAEVSFPRAIESGRPPAHRNIVLPDPADQREQP
jgi:hypothetical protein